MLQQSLRNRIADNLKKYAPFDQFRANDLLSLAEKVIIQYLNVGDFVFKQDDAPKGFCFFIKEGSVKLVKNVEGAVVLLNQCDEGDCFGVRQLFLDDIYWFNAEVNEETLLYAIPIDLIKGFLEKYPTVTFFFAQSFAANIRQATEQIVAQPEKAIQLSSIFSLDKVRAAVTCSPDTNVKAAAILMTAEKISSLVVVDETQRPLGILSDSTLRKMIATGRFDIEAKVETVMTKPAACTQAGVSLTDIQIQMIRKKVRYLCVTEDGTAASKLQGIVSEHDLIIAHGNNPAVLLREIQYCQSAESLRLVMQRTDILLENYLNIEVSTHFVANIIAELNDALTIRAIEIAQKELERDGVEKPENINFCWLALGSQGRREQLLKTDQDNALIFTDANEADYVMTKAYFILLAEKVTATLHHAGFDYCTGNMMASNPQWCLSLSEWVAQFVAWMEQPNDNALLQYKIFFDFRAIWGDKGLSSALAEKIYQHIEKNKIFLTFMAKSAVENPPPLSFFRNLIVEKNGEHKNEFNIKARGLVPIADAVRALMLGTGITKKNNTITRLEALADLEPQNKQLYLDVAKSYETILGFRAKQGFKHKNSGKYINPDELDKLDRLLLRQCFRPIEDLQQLVSIRFGTSVLR